MTSVTEPGAGTEPLSIDPQFEGSPRLARHSFTLSDGHRIGLAVSGRGVPLVVVHGFSAEGFLYAQTLHRLVSKGFKVIAIDMAGHGGTQGLPDSGARLGDYADLMYRCVSELGIRKAVLAGHSMGGRIVAQLAANHPDDVVALLLIDAIVGETWDWMVNVFRFSPPLLGLLAGALIADSATTLPLVRDPSQAAKLGRLLTPTAVAHAMQPWRLIGPAVSILRSRGSRGILEELELREIPTFVIHGDLDVAVPMRTARSAAALSGGQLVQVHCAGHSWLLKDPETLPAIVEELLEDRLGVAIRQAMASAGANTLEELEEAFFEPDAPILGLTPDLQMSVPSASGHPPRYRWTVR